MPTSDYTSATGRGSLRLKGVNPSSKITKPKKKRPRPAENAPDDPATTASGPKSKPQEPEAEGAFLDPNSKEESKPHGKDQQQDADNDESMQPRAGKTEAEIRHEERRRRRLEDRLKREGTKTHKEKVEEFNHYLSNLSEHHDMPRIGPG
ncbi:MAG: hypothetical protein Q9168_005913 [Polycauliona sp. 1 TL-2023]